MTSALETRPGKPRVLDRIAVRVLPPSNVLGEPGTALAPLAMILVVSLLTASAMHFQGWVLPGSPPMGAALRRWILVLSALAPVVALVKAAVLTAVAWSMLVLLGATAAPRAILSALLYGEVILSLQAPMGLFLGILRGGLAHDRFTFGTGLDAFVDPSHGVLFALARGVTPFQIAWIVYLALALSSRAGVSRLRGGAASGALWLLLTGLGVLRAYLTGGTA